MIRPVTIVFIVLTALACAALVYLQRIDVAGAAAVAKLLASSGFIATAISAGALGHRFGRVMVVGFVLSWIGDFFLIGTARQTFLLGLASFLAAHLAYMTAFVIHGQDRRWLAIASFPLILVALGVSAWLAPHVPAELVVPVRAYTVVITLMVIMAFGARGAGAPGVVVLGALLFFGSDLSVAALRIVGTDFPSYVWGLPMYYAGQLCLAVGAGQHDT
jgi:uncharacterized membrane protein YhhN